MSFKLTDEKGASHNKLNNRRRVDDLLLESIPATEYLVNRSGKYCCKVCPHWPVFDTLAMLKSHRDSRKHKHNSDEWSKATMKKQLEQVANQILPSNTEDVTKLAERALSSHLACQFDDNLVEKAHKNKRKTLSSCSCDVDDATGASGKRQRKAAPFFQPNYRHICNCKNEKKGNSLRKDISSSQCGEEIDAERTEVKKNQNNKINTNYPTTRVDSKMDHIVKTTASSSQTIGEQEMNLMKYYAKMKQNGWILSNGEWTKDEECEFDSDDEPPKFEEVSKWNK
ncbi:sodium channel modifier 1-like [Rhopilema esculentum]|uniref:sodium channel modifier 1-like n=1 Tax=Rhopilema esculentum TaxID=499914 RepID=UPI0031DDAD2A|eukprot:gene4947-21290_t